MNGNERSADQFTYYALGRISKEIETLSRDSEIPAVELTHRLATLLLSAACGPSLGVNHRMPTLSGEVPEGNQTVGALALASGSYRKTPRKIMSAAARARIARAQRKRWREAKRPSKGSSAQATYWQKNFPTPSSRHNEIMRRRRVAARKRGGTVATTKAA